IYEFELMRNERSTIFQINPAPLRVTFLVLSGSSIMCVASAIDPLRAANRIAGEKKFDWSIVSADGAPPQTTAGIPVAASDRFDPSAATDALIVIGGFGSRVQTSPMLIAG